MPLFKNCLAVINTRSGAREGRSVFASALQQYLDRAGIPHTDILVPEMDIYRALHAHLPSADCLIVCGGDGTVSSVVNVLAASALSGGAERLIPRPIAVVPVGLQNSIAHSLGVSSAERSVSQFVIGRADAVPVWEVCLDGRPLRYMCAYVAVGTYAETVTGLHTLDRVGEDYIALPSIKQGKFTAAAMYTTILRPSVVPCTAHARRASGRDSAAEPSTVVYEAPLRMLLASQMPLQHGGYSLTPRATYRRGLLSTTTASVAASRARMWHLLKREGGTGVVLDEDGVCTLDDVEELRLSFAPSASSAGADKKDEEAVLVVDGEAVRVPPGSVVTVKQLPHFSLPFLVC